MIISCPSCATQYDVESTSFSPGGRSVLCAVCETSWFVPAPVPISTLVKKNTPSPQSSQAPSKFGQGPLEQAPLEEDDTLFDIVDPDEVKKPTPSQNLNQQKWEEETFPDRARSSQISPEQMRDEKPEPTVESAYQESNETPNFRDDHEQYDPYTDKENPPNDKAILDADFQDVQEENHGYEKGFGRRLRQDRRRATALTRLEDLDETAERVFNDEFFKALHVQPKELEKALRKARRRAESREKNRLTPLRAIGWSVWLCVVLATVFTAYTYREDIVNAWPKASAAYAVIGIEAEPDGLKIEALSHRIAMSTVGPTIEVTGEIFNDSDESMPAPLLQAEALDAKGALLSRWTFEIDVEQLHANARNEFTTRSPAPEGVAEIALTFAPKPKGE